MAGRRPKLAEIDSTDEFSHWLAETIQEKVAKENAGFVQIERSSVNASHEIAVTSHTTLFHLTIRRGA